MGFLVVFWQFKVFGSLFIVFFVVLDIEVFAGLFVVKKKTYFENCKRLHEKTTRNYQLPENHQKTQFLTKEYKYQLLIVFYTMIIIC